MMRQTRYRLAVISLSAAALACMLAGCQQNSAIAPRPSATWPPSAMPPTAVAQRPTATALPPRPTATASEGAAQAIASYYQAIGHRQYAQAYQIWADGGAASGQTAAQFAQGFAQTAGVQIALGETTAQGQSASVPITITSVENLASGAQEVRRYAGAYVLRQDEGWKITSASIQQTATNPQPPAERGDAAALIQAYYRAINDRQYGRAYTYWADNGGASQQSLAQFAQGFAGTSHVDLAIGQPEQDAAAGSAYASIPAAIVAQQQDGSIATFCGSYQLRRANVEPFQLLGWGIEKAQISPVGSAGSAKDVLESGCGR